MTIAAQHQLGMLAFLVVMLLVAVSNAVMLRRMERYKLPDGRLPKLSILVPARNEAENIGDCLRSLLAQDYPHLEILALDDESSDGTGAIIAELARSDPRLRLLQGMPPPHAWLGKHWACQQLAEASSGELLLFTDADVRFRPRMASQTVAAMAREQADLLAALPHEQTGTWGERLTVPIMAWSLFSLLPLALAYRLHWPPLSAGIGQFLLFRRSAYEAIGGHASVRNDTAEDLALTRRTVAHGLRWRLVDGRALIHCRMYTGLRQSFQGLSKSLYAAFGYHSFFMAFAWLWLGMVFLESPLVLLIGALGLPLGGFSLPLAGLLTGLAALLWLLFSLRLGYSPSLALLYPLVMLLALSIATHSIYTTLTGQASWKGRPLPPQPKA